jgi:DNA-binding Lrp family transcriptional regulator
MNQLQEENIEDIDFKILEQLSENGRLSYRQLAKILNKSPVTIKKHIEELEDKGIINNYGAQINYERLGYDIIAIIEITISGGKMMEVEHLLAKEPNIYAVYDITGSYDASVIARFRSREELNEMVKKINSSNHVIRTNTHLILNVIKEQSSFGKLMADKNSQENEEI